MPRDGSQVYHIPLGTEGAPDTTIESAKYNTFAHDVEQDLNTPRPIVAGGTGSSNPASAIVALGAETAFQHVDNYDSFAFVPGSFYSDAGATNEPVDGHSFVGICYLSDNNNIAVEARDMTDAAHKVYTRVKAAGVWTVWVIRSSADFVFRAGDTMTGPLTLAGDPTTAMQPATKQYVDARIAVIPSAGPPPIAVDGTMWWETDTGLLYIMYNDGDSRQWVIACPQPDMSGWAFVNSPTFTGDPKAPTPTPGDNDTSIATTAFVTAAVATGVVSAGGGAIQNLIGDNGSFEIWQRGGGVAVAASAVAYTADRWYVANGANQVMNCGPISLGTINGSLNAGRFTRNSGQTGVTPILIAYPLTTDEIALLRGQRATLSFAFRCGAQYSGGVVSVKLYTGQGGGAAKRNQTPYANETLELNVTTIMPVNIWATASFTTSAAVNTSVTCGELQFLWTPSGTAGSDDALYLDDVQLEVGTTAHPYARTSFNDQLDKCQYMFWKSFPIAQGLVQNGGTTGSLQSTYAYAAGAPCNVQAFFPRRMRAAPALTTYAPDANTANFSGGIPVAAAVSREWGAVLVTGAGSVAASAYNIHLSADASI